MGNSPRVLPSGKPGAVQDKEMAWLAPHDGSPGRPAVFSDAAIQFYLTIKGEGRPDNSPVDCCQP